MSNIFLKKFSLVAILVLSLVITSCEKGKDIPYDIICLADSAPFSYSENGVMKGLEIDLINTIAADQKIAIRLHPMTSTEMLKQMKRKNPKYEGAIGMITRTYDRKEFFDFSNHYFSSGISIGVKAGRGDISSISDLKGLKVVTTKGTLIESYVESIRDSAKFTYTAFDNVNDAFKAVISGNADAIIEESPLIDYRQAQGQGIISAYKGVQNQVFTLIVKRKQNEDLIKIFNTGLDNITKNGTFKTIKEKYFPL